MASNHKFAPHIADIKPVLGRNIDEDLLLEDFHTLVNNFHIPVEGAKRSVIKKHGVRQLVDLRAGEREVNVIIRFSNVKTRKTSIKGRQTTVSFGMLTDETGEMPFIAQSEYKLSIGDVATISHGSVRKLGGNSRFTYQNSLTLFKWITIRFFWLKNWQNSGMAIGTLTCLYKSLVRN